MCSLVGPSNVLCLASLMVAMWATCAKVFVRLREGCAGLLQALQPSRLGGSGVLLGTREGQRSFCDCSERSLSLTDPTFLCRTMFYLAWSHSGSSFGLFFRLFSGNKVSLSAPFIEAPPGPGCSQPSKAP